MLIRLFVEGVYLFRLLTESHLVASKVTLESLELLLILMHVAACFTASVLLSLVHCVLMTH